MITALHVALGAAAVSKISVLCLLGSGMMVARVDTAIVHQIGMILDVVDGMKARGTLAGKA